MAIEQRNELHLLTDEEVVGLCALVTEGARVMDEADPERFANNPGARPWYRTVDIEELRMSSRTACILGQVDGDYDNGKWRLDIEKKEAEEMGFTLPMSIGDDEKKANQQWLCLGMCWTAEIQARINAEGEHA
jgi:hypothetical protein